MRLPETGAAELALRVVTRCRTLAQITDVPGETTRTFLSEGMRRANEKVAGWMRDAGLNIRVDAAGNLRGVLPGSGTTGATFLIASHLDTVPNAGAFDGPLGVLLGVALAAQIGPGFLPFELEIVGFSEEEGVRFGTPFLGSRALVGTLTDDLLALRDEDGVSVREAMHRFGLPADLDAARLGHTVGALEFHIEQGPELDAEDLPVGVVETVAGQSRHTLTFTGRANHAGTTPMRSRHDAMSAAAAFIVEAERYARAGRGLVATVGSIHAEPNVGNVIAGEVRLSLDVRSANDSTREDAVQHLLAFAEALAVERRLCVATEMRLVQPAVPLDRNLLCLLENSMEANDALVRRMTSGAGHDAMILAPHLPTAMLFLRSPEGLSHHPQESVRTEDVALALEIGYTFLHTVAAQIPRMDGDTQ